MSAVLAGPRTMLEEEGRRREINYQLQNALAAIGNSYIPIAAEKVERNQVGMGPGRASPGTLSVYPLAESNIPVVSLSITGLTWAGVTGLETARELGPFFFSLTLLQQASKNLKMSRHTTGDDAKSDRLLRQRLH